MTKRLNIAVAGAGIGGLAAATLLKKRGHNVIVFDQFDDPKPVGSGLVIQPVGQQVLDAAGAGDAAQASGNAIQRMLGHEADANRKVLNVWYDRKPNGRHGLAIHRASLFAALYDAAIAQGVQVQGGARVQHTRSGMVALANGRTEGPFDLVVDAAGAKSPLSPIKTTPLPYGAIWGTVDWPQTTLPKNYLSQCYRKANRMVGVLPIGTLPGSGAQKAAIFWSMPQDHHAAWQDAGLDAWRQEAVALWPDFAPFAAQITATEQMTMTRYAHGTLRQPFSEGLVHIGDAAHQASPQLGQGANMALLDALALTKALDMATGTEALTLYAKARRLHVQVYQGMSSAFTPQYQSDSTWLPVLRDRVLYPLSQIPPVPRILTSLVCGTMLPPLGKLRKS